MNKLMIEWMNEWMNERMNEWRNTNYEAATTYADISFYLSFFEIFMNYSKYLYYKVYICITKYY